MKKILFTALILLVFVGVKAQDFGVKFGLNYSNWHMSEDISAVSDPLFGLQAGVFAKFDLSEKIAFQPELLYSSKGIIFTDADMDLKQNYLDIPILFSYKITPDFSVNLGPEIGFLLSASLSDDTGTEDVKSLFQSFEYGVDFGMSYQTSIGLLIDARYNLGISDIATGDFSGGDKIVNRVFQFSLGYVIPMHKGKQETIEF